MEFPVFPMRQIHLDFHTSPDIPDVGADWDADHFIETLSRAQVNSITVFAKCHHGMNYYPTKIGPVHPSLKFDLLGAQIEACHRAGIRCPIYLTVVWDVSAAHRHPEWRQIDTHGKYVGAFPLGDAPLPMTSWPWMCVNTGYADELIAQTEELIGLYGSESDVFFYDIVMMHADGCVCERCLKSLRAADLDPTNAVDRRRNNNRVARRFMHQASGVIRARLPQAGVFYNSRWGLGFADEQQYYSQVEIESLPTGGWGYGFYPLWSRYGRGFGPPMLGMTGRFHRTWADWGGLKHPDALKFECGGILATGGAISIGDQLHPRGRLNEAVYDVIGEAFRDVKAVEDCCIGATAVTQIGLLILAVDSDRATLDPDAGGAEGASKILLENHHQFDVITDKSCSDFGRYDLLVLPDRAVASAETVARLKAFVAGGGKLLLSHQATFDGANFALADEIGADYVGAAASNPDYFAVTDPALAGVVTRIGFPYSLYEGPSTRVAARAGVQTLANAFETYFNRTGEHFTSHGFTPPLPTAADYPAIVRNGCVVYIYGPIFGAYQKYGNLTFRSLVGKCIDLLLPKRVVETDAPCSAEVSLMSQPKQNRYIAHIVNYVPQRRAPGHVEALDAPIPLHDVRIRLTVGADSVTRVFVARSGETLPHTVANGTVSVVVPRVASHEAVVFQCEAGPEAAVLASR